MGMITMIVADGYLQWQGDVLEYLQSSQKKDAENFAKMWRKGFMQTPLLKGLNPKKVKEDRNTMKRYMDFASYMVQEVEKRGVEALGTDVAFDEYSFLDETHLAIVMSSIP